MQEKLNDDCNEGHEMRREEAREPRGRVKASSFVIDCDIHVTDTKSVRIRQASFKENRKQTLTACLTKLSLRYTYLQSLSQLQ